MLLLHHAARCILFLSDDAAYGEAGWGSGAGKDAHCVDQFFPSLISVLLHLLF